MIEPLRRDEGMSLVELMVAMLVTGIVLAILGNLFVQVTSAATAANTARASVGTASTAMNAMAKVIRQASPNAIAASTTPDPAVVSGTANALTVYSYVDTSATAPAPTKVTYTVNSANYLVETRVAAVASGSYWGFTGATSTRTIAGPLTTTGPMFAYQDATGATLPIAAGGLTAAQRAQVVAVAITVTVPNTVRGGSDPIVLTNTVVLQNVALAQGGN